MQSNSIQSPPHPTSRRSILKLSSHLRLGLPNGLFPSGFPNRTLCTPLPLPHTRHMPRPSHSSRFSPVCYGLIYRLQKGRPRVRFVWNRLQRLIKEDEEMRIQISFLQSSPHSVN